MQATVSIPGSAASHPVLVEAYVRTGPAAFTVHGWGTRDCANLRDDARSLIELYGYDWPLRRIDVAVSHHGARFVRQQIVFAVATAILRADGQIAA